MIWFHEKVLRHEVRRVEMMTVPPWDRSARKLLVSCACKRVWTR
jgi:hypothetical protein